MELCECESMSSLHERLFVLESTVLQLKTEVESLKNENSQLRIRNDELQHALIEQPPSFDLKNKKVRTRSEDTCMKYLFYHEHKNDPAVVAALQERQMRENKEYIPWHWKKQETDRLWLEWKRHYLTEELSKHGI